jgi:hypothetical protein
MSYAGKRKMQEWNRRKTSQLNVVGFTRLQPYVHRCDRCRLRDLSGVVCPDCHMRRAVVFLDVYGVVPDTRPYAQPRRLPVPLRSYDQGVPMAGYPESNRYGRKRGRWS